MLECNPLLFHNLDLPGVHTVWGVITVKNNCSVMISTISLWCQMSLWRSTIAYLNVITEIVDIPYKHLLLTLITPHNTWPLIILAAPPQKTCFTIVVSTYFKDHGPNFRMYNEWAEHLNARIFNLSKSLFGVTCSYLSVTPNEIRQNAVHLKSNHNHNNFLKYDWCISFIVFRLSFCTVAIGQCSRTAESANRTKSIQLNPLIIDETSRKVSAVKFC